MSSDDARAIPGLDGERALTDVLRELRAGLRAIPPDEWLDPRGPAFRALLQWARSAGAFYGGYRPPDACEGGREHSVIFEPQRRTWRKITFPSTAGFIPFFDEEERRFHLEPGLPVPYLERLLLQNEIFRDKISFVGVGGEPHKLRIITRQPHIDGRKATGDEILEGMTQLQFKRLPSSFSLGYEGSMTFLREDVVVFDLRPANVVMTSGGIMMPIDCIPTRVDEDVRRFLESHLG